MRFPDGSPARCSAFYLSKQFGNSAHLMLPQFRGIMDNLDCRVWGLKKQMKGHSLVKTDELGVGVDGVQGSVDHVHWNTQGRRWARGKKWKEEHWEMEERYRTSGIKLKGIYWSYFSQDVAFLMSSMPHTRTELPITDGLSSLASAALCLRLLTP